MITKIYGASDDLIEIDGNISDEIDCYNNTNKAIVFSDGTEAKITYDGNWRVKLITKGDLFDRIVFGNEEDKQHTDVDAKGCSNYSDVLIMKEGIEWVKIGRKTFKP